MDPGPVSGEVSDSLIVQGTLACKLYLILHPELKQRSWTFTFLLQSVVGWGLLGHQWSWGPKADKRPRKELFWVHTRYPGSPWVGLQSLRCLPLERKKNIDPGERCAEVIKGIWPEPRHCTYPLSKLFFCFGETLKWGDGGRQFLEGKGWQTFSLKSRARE